MRKLKVLIALAIIMGAAAFIRPKTDYTNYYWFDTSNNYLHQNTIDNEEAATGYDNSQYNPHTRQEKGYTVAQLRTITPPTVYTNSAPLVSLYSHP